MTRIHIEFPQIFPEPRRQMRSGEAAVFDLFRIMSRPESSHVHPIEVQDYISKNGLTG